MEKKFHTHAWIYGIFHDTYNNFDSIFHDTYNHFYMNKHIQNNIKRK